MNSTTFAALTNYTSAATAIAAKSTNGQAWLLDETLIYQDGTMPKSGPASIKNSRQVQMSSTLYPTVLRNQGSANTTGGTNQSTPGGGSFVNRVTEHVTKTPAIGTLVTWFVTDSSKSVGYRQVSGVLS